MNYMEQVAKMLGVELGEEFCIKDKGCKRKLTKDGMFFCYKDNWNKTRYDLSNILTGEYKIIKKPILDEVEKKYLSNVIKPFRSKVKYIVKRNDNKSEYFEDIRVAFESSYKVLYFPYFEKGTMYKGMELDKKYSLKDLGL